MKVIFACAGTGGHINPAIAMAGIILKHEPQSNILFIGTENGLENKLVKNAGYEGTFLGTDGWDGVLSVKDVDKSIFNGAYYTNTFDDRVEDVQNYVAKYKEKYDSDTNMFGTMAYDATWVLLKAVEAAGTTDYAKICEELEKTNYDGITGHFEFDDQHNPTKELVVKTIKNGEYSYLD